MRGQFRGDVDLPTLRRINANSSRVEVELAADSAGQERLRTAVLGVPDDRMADRRHVRTQLVRAAGQRLELDPGRPVAGAVDHSPARLGGKAMLAVDMHLLAPGARLLCQRSI